MCAYACGRSVGMRVCVCMYVDEALVCVCARACMRAKPWYACVHDVHVCGRSVGMHHEFDLENHIAQVVSISPKSTNYLECCW